MEQLAMWVLRVRRAAAAEPGARHAVHLRRAARHRVPRVPLARRGARGAGDAQGRRRRRRAAPLVDALPQLVGRGPRGRVGPLVKDVPWAGPPAS